MPPETVAHYRLRERLGSGAMGEVWLAEDTRLHRLVALKMLPAASAGDAEAAARLVREARVASSLNHPNVAVVYDVGETEHDGRNACYVAMEYVKGRALAQLLEGAIVGTLAYMSPEQARGHAIDARSDVFSLGVLLHELLAGRRPFEGTNAVELVEAILTKDPPPPSTEGPLAAGLFQLVARMLEKDPARRPGGMREVLRRSRVAPGRERPGAGPRPRPHGGGDGLRQHHRPAGGRVAGHGARRDGERRRSRRSATSRASGRSSTPASGRPERRSRPQAIR